MSQISSSADEKKIGPSEGIVSKGSPAYPADFSALFGSISDASFKRPTATEKEFRLIDGLKIENWF